MLKRTTWTLLAGAMLASLVVSACQPTTTTVEVPVTQVVVQTQVVEEVQTQVVEVEVTAVPTVAPTEPKVMVVCMAQEPQTLYTLSEAALVKSAVLEAVYDWGVDTRGYSYQPVGLTKLPSLDDGDASIADVEVGIGDAVYNVATDEVVTLTPTSTVTLSRADGSSDDVDFSQTTTAMAAQMTVSWTLVDGITWEDGEPVTTDDIMFAWEVASSPDSPNSKYVIDRTTSYTAVDDKTWTWVSLPGYTSGTYFLDAVNRPLPRHQLGSMTPAQMLEDEGVNRDPLAYGPFKIDEWVAGDHITLSKNPTYYRASEGLPKLDQLIYRFVPDTNQLIAQLASGECDLGTQDAAFEGSLPLIRQFETEGLMTPQIVAGTTFEHLDFDTLPVDSYTGFAGRVKNDDGTPIFANVSIRQAIAYCLDRQAIIDATTNGAGVIMHAYSPSDHPLYPGDDNITQYGFDPAKGLELLAAAGWTDSDGDGILDKGGEKFSFVHSTRNNPLRAQVTQVVQAQLKENCMIETTIELVGGEYFSDGPDGMVFGRQYDLGEFAWLTGVEPGCTIYATTAIPNEVNGWGASNNTGWSNAEFDAACAAAGATLNADEKKAQHGLAMQIFAENLPAIPLFSRGKILVTGPNVTGVIMDPTANSELWNVENFDLVQ
ncbi:MAG: peptide ABC transporter substrate-binding protein [Anaerolineales bacterium]|nr:peptide ABC transporter substrate-binding protein [Anaerolineales bacterium]